ncbi:hypothetical protein BT69DRAFT_1331337 [Atractiella rhizophila]|nr:hypothetical protein BT69DRAFT_1331337 [Atractiella rhizophila]
MSYPLTCTQREAETKKDKGTLFGIPKLDLTLQYERLKRYIHWSVNPFSDTERKYLFRDYNQPEWTDSRSIVNGYITEGAEPSTSTIENEEDQDAPSAPDEEWLDGLTDLFFVGSLATFNDDHELSTKAQLVNYAAYFIVIWWIWNSQILLDLKFQTSDGFTRFIKIYQLLIFATLEFHYRANAGNGWFNQEEADILPIFNDKDTTSALQTFAVVYIISRVVLVLQYNAADLADRLVILVVDQTTTFIIDQDVNNLLNNFLNNCTPSTPFDIQPFDIQDGNNKEIIHFMKAYVGDYSWLGFLWKANTTFYQILAENGCNRAQEDLICQAYGAAYVVVREVTLSKVYKLCIAIIPGGSKVFKINLDEETIYTGRAFTISGFVSYDNYVCWTAQVYTNTLKPSLFHLPVAGGFLISIIALRLNTCLPKGVLPIL